MTSSKVEQSSIEVMTDTGVIAQRICRTFSLSVMVFSPESGYKFEITIIKGCDSSNRDTWAFKFELQKRNDEGKFDVIVKIDFKAGTQDEAEGIEKIADEGISLNQLRTATEETYPVAKVIGDEQRAPTSEESEKINSSIQKIVLN